MSKSDPMPGLLSVDASGGTTQSEMVVTRNANNKIVARLGDYYRPQNNANARRLVACWNALEGMPTEFLEEEFVKNGIFREIFNAVSNELLNPRGDGS